MMNAFPRMGTKTAMRLWRLVMGGSAIYAGMGYAFGPPGWYQSPSLELVRQFVIPVPVWGFVMMIAGFLIFSKLRPVGHFIAATLWAFWFTCIAVVALASLVNHMFQLDWHMPEITGWGAPAYVLVYAMVHLHMLVGPRTMWLIAPREHVGDDSG